MPPPPPPVAYIAFASLCHPLNLWYYGFPPLLNETQIMKHNTLTTEVHIILFQYIITGLF